MNMFLNAIVSIQEFTYPYEIINWCTTRVHPVPLLFSTHVHEIQSTKFK